MYYYYYFWRVAGRRAGRRERGPPLLRRPQRGERAKGDLSGALCAKQKETKSALRAKGDISSDLSVTFCADVCFKLPQMQVIAKRVTEK